ncbi:MAG: glycosyltransferase [Desulfobacterales bacterium]|nr:glycosyltransferase [Desulfobacterales bacterium]
MLSEDVLVPYQETDLTGKRVLVLAPHPDDETLGCGGSLIRHVKAGDSVKVVFLTDGAKGDFSGQDEPEAYMAVRRQEAIAACSRLGIGDREFWSFADRSLAETPRALEKLSSLFAAWRPELVYAPSPFEFHPDHRAAAFLVFALSLCCRFDFDIAFYEVNQPLKVNCLVDITAVAEAKYEAIGVYESQLREKNFLDLTQGLNRFRSMTLSESAVYAEAFYLVNSSKIDQNGLFSVYEHENQGLYAEWQEYLQNQHDKFHLEKKHTPDTNPQVSVIIPTYNRPNDLYYAVESVLAQTFQDFEIIVVNDGGEDVAPVIDALNTDGKIRCLTHEQRKDVAAARNTGLRASRGLYIAYLDDDDIYYPQHLEILVHALQYSDYQFAYTDANQVVMNWITDRYVPTEKRVRYSYDFDRDKLLISNYIPTLNILHRRDLLDKIGYFDERLAVHEDWDMWIRASLDHDFQHVAKTTAEFRVKKGPQQSKSEQKIAFSDTIKVIHKRYAHLVKSPSVSKAQKQAQQDLDLELRDAEKFLIIRDYQRQHFYQFARFLCDGGNVLDVTCGDGSGCYLLTSAARYVVGTDLDSLWVSRAGAMYVKDNLRFVSTFLDSPNDQEKDFYQLIACFDFNQFWQQSGAGGLDKIQNRLDKNGVLILSVHPPQSFSQRAGPHQELDFNGWRTLLAERFKNVRVWEENVYPVSVLSALFEDASEITQNTWNADIKRSAEISGTPFQAGFFLVMASNGPLPQEPDSYFLVDSSASLFQFWEGFIDRLEVANVQKESEIEKLSAAEADRKNHVKNLEAFATDQQEHAANLEKELTDQRAHAGNLERELEDQRARANNLEKELEDGRACTASLEKEQNIQNEKIQTLTADQASKQKTIDILNQSLNEFKATDTYQKNEIDRLTAVAEDRRHRIISLEDMAAEKDAILGDIETELAIIRHSFAWRLVEGFRRWANIIFPDTSRRRKVYLKFISAGKIYLDKGVFGVIRHIKRKYGGRKRHHDSFFTKDVNSPDNQKNQAPKSLNADQEISPVSSKRLPDQAADHDADMQMVKEKIANIKQELLNEVLKNG